jgi:hypothetical protein
MAGEKFKILNLVKPALAILPEVANPDRKVIYLLKIKIRNN